MGNGIALPRIRVRTKKRKPKPPGYYFWKFFSLLMFLDSFIRLLEMMSDIDVLDNCLYAGSLLIYGILGHGFARNYDPDDEKYVANAGRELTMWVGAFVLTFTSYFV